MFLDFWDGGNFKKKFHVFVILGATDGVPLWQWDQWSRIYPALDGILHEVKGPAAITVLQSQAGEEATLQEMAWNEEVQREWADREPANASELSDHLFRSIEVWSPSRAWCEEKDTVPDVFVGVRNERALFKERTQSSPYVVLAVHGHSFEGYHCWC